MKKLDMKTLLFLYITKVKIVETPKVIDNDKSGMNFDYSPNVYIFEDYEEYKHFFEMYMDRVDESLIEMAIYTRGSKGQIVALKGLCNQIIRNNEVNGFYDEKELAQVPVLKKSKVRAI